eukprot:11258792-Alexandrium_andersonii.AAC.1
MWTARLANALDCSRTAAWVSGGTVAGQGMCLWVCNLHLPGPGESLVLDFETRLLHSGTASSTLGRGARDPLACSSCPDCQAQIPCRGILWRSSCCRACCDLRPWSRSGHAAAVKATT